MAARERGGVGGVSEYDYLLIGSTRHTHCMTTYSSTQTRGAHLRVARAEEYVGHHHRALRQAGTCALAHTDRAAAHVVAVPRGLTAAAGVPPVLLRAVLGGGAQGLVIRNNRRRKNVLNSLRL